MELEKCSTVYGFAFVDCAALRFWVGSISDDASCAALGALLMQVCKFVPILLTLCPYYWFAGMYSKLPSGIFFQVSPKEVIYDSKGKLLLHPMVCQTEVKVVETA